MSYDLGINNIFFDRSIKWPATSGYWPTGKFITGAPASRIQSTPAWGVLYTLVRLRLCTGQVTGYVPSVCANNATVLRNPTCGIYRVYSVYDLPLPPRRIV